MSINRKMRRQLAKENKPPQSVMAMTAPLRRPENLLTEEEYNRIVEQIKDDFVPKIAEYIAVQTLAISLKIIMEHGGYIHKLNTRVEHFCELYKQGLESPWDDGKLSGYYEYLNTLGEEVRWHYQQEEEPAEND